MLSMFGLSSARQYATAELYRYALRPSTKTNSAPEPHLCAQRRRDRTSRQSLLSALVKGLPAQASLGFSMPAWPLQVAVSVFRHWVCRASWDSIAASNGLLLMTDNVSFSERGARIVADEVRFLPLVAFRFPPDVPVRFSAVCSCFARSYTGIYSSSELVARQKPCLAAPAQLATKQARVAANVLNLFW